MSERLGQTGQPELPRGLDNIVALLLAKLEQTSHDTGDAYYLDYYPIEPEHPDEYAVEVSIRIPKNGN